MKEQLISFETAKLAKEKGFDIEVNQYFKEAFPENLMNHNVNCNFNKYIELCCSAPTQSLLQKWLREIFGYEVLLDIDLNLDYFVCIKHRDKGLLFESKNTFKTYEEALEKGLQESLKLIK